MRQAETETPFFVGCCFFSPEVCLKKDNFEVSTNMAFATNKPMRSLNKAGFATSRFSHL